MKRLLFGLVVLGLVGASPRAWASCRPFGTQLHCTLGGGEMVIGTQTTADDRLGALPALPLHGGDGLFDAHPVIGWPLRVELQNVGSEPALCRRFGDETYCY